MQITPIDGTTYGGKLNLDDIEIGDILSPTFKPHIKMKRWNGLCDMAISYPTTSTGLIMYDGVNHILRYPVDNNTDIEISGIDPKADSPEGAMELNVILKKKPNKNTITLMLESDSIDFKKILPLDVEYDQAACLDHFPKHTPPFVITPTSITDASGEVLKTRDERLCNSYRGRAKKNYHVKRECGEVKVKSSPYFGKQIIKASVSRTTAHIRRGKAIDADGVEAWVEDMNLDPDGTLTITLPADFIKTAKYPIRQAVGLDPAYTEDMENWITDYGSDNTWEDYDIFTNHSVPKGAVAEVIIANVEAGTEMFLGIRTDGSAINRYVEIHECEGGGYTTCRMFVTCHVDTGLVETWSEDVSDECIFYLVGYWENVGFTEFSAAFLSLDTDDDAWDSVTTVNLPAERVCHIIMGVDEELAVEVGVREAGSSLNRKVLIHEAEGGGDSFVDMFVKSSSGTPNATIEHFDSSLGGSRYNIAGYFGEELDFTELFQLITNDGDGDWDATDLTAYLDEDERVVDFLLTHNDIADPHFLGVRDGDDGATLRYIQEHEAEDDGNTTGEVTGFGISAQSNASGIVNIYSDTTSEVFYLMGYFKPAAVGGIDYPISTSPGLTASATVAYKAAWDRTVAPGLTTAVTVAYKVAWDRTVNSDLAMSVTILKGWGRAIATSADLTINATVARKLGFKRAISSGLTISSTVARKLGFKRAISAGVTTAVTIARLWNRTIVTTANLTVSSTIARFMTYTRDTTSNLTASATVVKSWGRAIATSAGLTVSATVVLIKGFVRSLSPGLTVSATVARALAYKRATTPGLTASVTIARALAFKRAISAGLTISATVARFMTYTRALTPGLTISATIVKSFGWLITTSAGLTVSATVSKVVAFKRAIQAGLVIGVSIVATFVGVTHYLITVVSNLTVSTTIVKSFGRSIATTANLTVSTTISRVVAFKRAVSSGLTVSVSIVRLRARTIVTIANLTISTTISRILAYKRAISPSLAASVSIAKIWGIDRATTANLAVSTTISRVIAYKRVVSAGLTVSISLTRRWIIERATTTGLTLSVLVDRTVAYYRIVSANLDIDVSIAKSYGRYITTAANLTISVTINYCVVLRELLRIPIDALDTVRMVASRMVASRLAKSRLPFWHRRRICE